MLRDDLDVVLTLMRGRVSRSGQLKEIGKSIAKCFGHFCRSIHEGVIDLQGAHSRSTDFLVAYVVVY